MPLLATRPTVLFAISSAPSGLSFVTENSAGSVKVRSRSPVWRSNWYTCGPYSSEMNTLWPSLATRMLSGSRRASCSSPDGCATSKLSERPVK